MGKELEGVYTLDIIDIGNNNITAYYNSLEASVSINVKGPNLRSTEIDGNHLYFRTFDNKYLCIKEGDVNE